MRLGATHHGDFSAIPDPRILGGSELGSLGALRAYVIGVQGTPIRPTESSILIFNIGGFSPEPPLL